VSSYLGGAICAHVQTGEFDKAVSPAIILTRLMGRDLGCGIPKCSGAWRESDLAPGQAYRRRRHDARQAQMGTRWGL